jgi:hypothetical protein
MPVDATRCQCGPTVAGCFKFSEAADGITSKGASTGSWILPTGVGKLIPSESLALRGPLALTGQHKSEKGISDQKPE